jgi:hypothetical protein
VRALVPLALVAACQPPGNVGPLTTRPAPPAAVQFGLIDLVGDWRWLLRADEANTNRVEDEHWRFVVSPTVPGQLVGRYVRSVEVRSTDRVPFACNQRTWYRQRAVFDVVAAWEGEHVAVRETGYHAEPSPCDHGFRHIADYEADLIGGRLALHWAGGSQQLWKIDSDAAPLPEPPWPATPAVTGPWRWTASSLDDDGNVRDEDERWEITRRTDTRVDATYRRRVTVRSPDGSPLPCANAPSWTFDDTYVLEGQKEEEHWRFVEVGVDPGDHPCLRATPHRNLDEATAEQLGDYLVLEWRGKRHEILYRPE